MFRHIGAEMDAGGPSRPIACQVCRLWLGKSRIASQLLLILDCRRAFPCAPWSPRYSHHANRIRRPSRPDPISARFPSRLKAASGGITPAGQLEGKAMASV